MEPEDPRLCDLACDLFDAKHGPDCQPRIPRTEAQRIKDVAAFAATRDEIIARHNRERKWRVK
jgi:hypothetical protein